MDRKNIIIGIDGATWEIIDFFIDQNIMPEMKELKEKGCHGKLRSTFLPITPAAWASLMTGCRPPKTGIFHFMKSSGPINSYEKVLANGDDIEVPTLWEVLSQYGRDVVSINVPMTFPPQPVQGSIISGMMTPADETNFTYPEALKDELVENGIEYKIDTSLHRDRRKLHDPAFTDGLFADGAELFFRELFELLDVRKKTVHYMMSNKKWDYFMFVIIGVDRIQHHLWDHLKKDAGTDRTAHNIQRYFRAVDKMLGEICSRYREEANIFIVSDHGFARFYGDFLIDGWLLQNQFLKLKDLGSASLRRSVKNLLKRFGFNLNKTARKYLKESQVQQLKLSSSPVDWEKTVAYGASINGININLKGRETLGCVDPGDYNTIRETIISRLERITAPGGEQLLKHALKKEAIYGEAASAAIPDILLEFHDNLLYRGINTGPISADTGLFRTYDWLSGNHIRDGIFIALGKDISTGTEVNGMKIEDVLPTLLALNNEEIPSHLDGKIIKEIGRSALTATYKRFHTGASRGKYRYTGDKEEDIKEKLKSLGYI